MTALHDIIQNMIESGALQRMDHELNVVLAEDFQGLYADLRKNYCSFLESLSVVLLAPCCEECFSNQIFESPRLPDVHPVNWKSDLILECSPEFVEKVSNNVTEDENFSFYCVECQCELRPWEGDSFYVVKRFLNDFFNVGEEKENVEPSQKMKNAVYKCYGRKCFECGSTKDLHIDHILPRKHGGDGHFTNLQPLCRKCGYKKGNLEPEDLRMYSFAHFFLSPDDGYEIFCTMIEP